MSKPAVVTDNGSGRCKAGIAGEDSPKSVFPAVIGVPKQKGIMIGTGSKDEYVFIAFLPGCDTCSCC
mgnify:CR=1 FL=1